MLNGLLRKELLDLFIGLQPFERRLDDAVEEESKVDKEHETDNLECLERLPAETERDDPDEEGTAGINGGA